MAKKADTKKTASKKKTATKSKKKAVKFKAGKDDIMFFMASLVSAGYLGKELPKETKGKDPVSKSKAQNRAATEIRQMAEKLARQTKKFGEGDDD